MLLPKLKLGNSEQKPPPKQKMSSHEIQPLKHKCSQCFQSLSRVYNLLDIISLLTSNNVYNDCIHVHLLQSGFWEQMWMLIPHHHTVLTTWSIDEHITFFHLFLNWINEFRWMFKCLSPYPNFFWTIWIVHWLTLRKVIYAMCKTSNYTSDLMYTWICAPLCILYISLLVYY